VVQGHDVVVCGHVVVACSREFEVA
jgi:hypothetical protein